MSESQSGEAFYFKVGDYLVGALGGILVTCSVRTVIDPSWDIVAAMMVGMVVGTVVQIVGSIIFASLLGMFETMVPGMLIGMYGGMLFAMRDSMHGEVTDMPQALLVGALFGAAVVGGVQLLNARLQGVAFERSSVDQGGEG